MDSREFRDAGFCIIRELIPRSVVNHLRAELDTCHFVSPGVGLGILRVIRLGYLDEVIFATKGLPVFRDILDEKLSTFPNMTVRRDTQAPWHLDEAFRRPYPGWAQSNDCDFVQAMVYLQDNGDGGGGLDVVPGSHRLNELGTALGSVHGVIRYLMAKKQTIRTVTGDCVIWDCRLLHRSTQVSLNQNKNYGVQWTMSKRGANKRAFLDHLRMRGRDMKDVIGVDRRYNEIETFEFDEHAPKSFLQAAAANSVELFDITK